MHRRGFGFSERHLLLTAPDDWRVQVTVSCVFSTQFDIQHRVPDYELIHAG